MAFDPWLILPESGDFLHELGPHPGTMPEVYVHHRGGMLVIV